MKKYKSHRVAVLCYQIMIALLALFVSFTTLFAQPNIAGANKLKEEKEKFLHDLKSMSPDSSIVFPLSRYFDMEVSRIYRSVATNGKINTIEKEKAVRSLLYYIRELNVYIARRSLDIYDIPGSLNSYKNILWALLTHQPVSPILKPLAPRRSQLMAASFSQYKEYPLLDDIAVYKRVASSPEFILQFLESKPGFRFADSLLLDAATHDPLRIAYYLKSDQRGVQDKIRNTDNIYLEQIASLSADKNASELLPFVTQIAEKKLTTEEILQKRTEVTKYFQLLVNSLQESKELGDPGSIYLRPLRNGIREKAMAFYVNAINEQHAAAEAVRFAPVKGLRPQDLYYIITSCGEDLYTSSYLGLYKRLMESYRDQPVDSLFDLVQYDNLPVFMRLAANYNVLADFIRKMSPQRTEYVLQRFMAGIDADETTALERAMDIADSFTSLSAAPEIADLFEKELQVNLRRCQAGQKYLGVRLYSILSDILDMVQQKDGINRLWTTLGDYEVLKKQALENSKGEIVQLVLFYGDEDGVASFANFLRSYTDSKKWEITKNANWVRIRSLSGEPLIIYANRPLDMKDELDLRAQDSLISYLKEQSEEPSVLVHRGHSYHLDKTLKRITPSVKLAILGSCGGYNKAISIAGINPDIQVIGSKKTGSKSINDPIISEINETLLEKKDLQWPELWKDLGRRFMKDETSLSQFNEYFPPSHNLGLFVFKLFSYYNRVVKVPGTEGAVTSL